MNIKDICALVPVIPVLVVEDATLAGPLAKALCAGGLKVLEVTLRTPAALEAIRRMVEAAPEAVVGAGTLLTSADIVAAKAAGTRFGVSPGATPRLLDAAEEQDLPFLPGVATPSEAMTLAERGFEVLKFFPAAANGGPSTLSAWAAPMPSIRFCPTGGITECNAPDYLGLPNVACVGGSWVAPRDLVDRQDWSAISQRARAAASLKK